MTDTRWCMRCWLDAPGKQAGEQIYTVGQTTAGIQEYKTSASLSTRRPSFFCTCAKSKSCAKRFLYFYNSSIICNNRPYAWPIHFCTPADRLCMHTSTVTARFIYEAPLARLKASYSYFSPGLAVRNTAQRLTVFYAHVTLFVASAEAID